MSAPNVSMNNSFGERFVTSLPPAIINVSSELCHTEELQQRVFINRYHWVFILNLTICSINVCTNAFSYWVFRQDRNASILTRLLIRLSVTEVIFQLVFILLGVVENKVLTSQVALPYDKAVIFSYFVLYILFPLLSTIHIFRNWLVVLISSYRFEVVCRNPMGADTRVFRDDSICRITVLTLLSAFLVSLPRSLESSIRFCPTDTNLVLIYSFSGRASMIKWFVYLYTSCVLFLVQTAGPVIIVCVLSILLLQRLAVRRKFRRDMRRSSINHVTAATTAPEPPPPPPEEHLLDPNSHEKRKLSNNSEGSPSNGPMNFRQRLASLPRVIRLPLRRRSSSHPPSRRRDKDSGHLVLTLLVIFFFCEMPSFFSKVDSQLKLFSQETSFRFGHFANFTTLIDTFCNLFVYILSNAHFRSLLKVWYQTWLEPIFKCCECRK